MIIFAYETVAPRRCKALRHFTVKVKRKMVWAFFAVIMLFVSVFAAVRLSCRGGEGVTPPEDRYPIRGIDISAHNGEVDFAAVRRAGYRFVMIKATEGSAFKDRRFNVNIFRARKAGLKVGAYHFFRFDATGYMQALNFLHSLRGQKLDMPVVIDIEQWTNPTYRPNKRVVATLLTLIREIERRGLKVMLYTNKDGYDDFINDKLEDFPLWMCSFGDIAANVDWCIWQYSHRGSVDGVDGKVDVNVFNGSEAEWERWCYDYDVWVPDGVHGDSMAAVSKNAHAAQ